MSSVAAVVVTRRFPFLYGGFMKTYQCHKRVKAARILSVPQIAPDLTQYLLAVDVDGAAQSYIVGADWMRRHKPVVGGYLVEYEDGYVSFSPASAFLAGYASTDPLPTKVTREALEARIASVEYVVMPDGRTTICQLTMVNGFTARGESSCVSIENFVKADGEKYALQKAIDAVWAFEAYLLAERRYLARLSGGAA